MEELKKENIKREYNKSGIYYITVGRHSYVGSSVNIASRLRNHIWALCSKRHRNRIIQNCFNKYGISAFSFKILEFCNKNIRIERERYYINELHPDLNVAEPVTLVRDKPEYIERQRQIKKEYYKTHESANKIPVYRYTLTGEYVSFFSSATEASKFFGVEVSAIIAACNGRSTTSCGFQWRKQKSESIPSCVKVKIKKEKPKLPPKPGNKKRIYRYTLEGEYIDSYESASLADRSLNIHGCGAAARGNDSHRSVGGYLWSYTKEEHIKPYENHSKDAKKVSIIIKSIETSEEYEFSSIAEAVRTLFPNDDRFDSLCATISSSARRGGKIRGKYTARYK